MSIFVYLLACEALNVYTFLTKGTIIFRGDSTNNQVELILENKFQ